MRGNHLSDFLDQNLYLNMSQALTQEIQLYMNEIDRMKQKQQEAKKSSGMNIQLPAYYGNKTNSGLNNQQQNYLPSAQLNKPNPYNIPNSYNPNPYPYSNHGPPNYYNQNFPQNQPPMPPPQFINNFYNYGLGNIVFSKPKLIGFLIIFILSIVIDVFNKIANCSYRTCSSYTSYNNYRQQYCTSDYACLYFNCVLGVHLGTGIGYLILNFIIYCMGTQRLECFQMFLYSREQSNACQCWLGVLLGIFFPIVFIFALFYFIYFACMTCRNRPPINQAPDPHSAANIIQV